MAPPGAPWFFRPMLFFILHSLIGSVLAGGAVVVALVLGVASGGVLVLVALLGLVLAALPAWAIARALERA